MQKIPRIVSLATLFVALISSGCDSRSIGPADGAVIPDTGTPTDAGVFTDAGTPDTGAADTGIPDAGPVYPACGSNTYAWQGLIPGKGDPNFDADLDKLARAYDRCWTVFNAAPFGMNMDATVKLTNTENRDLIAKWLKERDDWDFKAYAGKEPMEVIDSWGDSVGMYGGAGAAADAFRYAVLRDRGEDCAEVARARAQLLPVLHALHRATEITGVPGVIARSITRRDLPGNDQIQTTPLFDDAGSPLPPEKNNGTWREDNSGKNPGWIWNDSCSRDMLVGWAQAYAAVYEVIRDDPSFDAALKARLREDARQIGLSLSKVQASGYDLEIRDADGRMTYHGVLNEQAIDRSYTPGVQNGFYAIMSLGIVSGLAYVSGDPDLLSYIKKELLHKRKLHILARDDMMEIDMGVYSNFSNDNMAITGAWLALRYTPDADARKVLQNAVENSIYSIPGKKRQPAEMKQTFFDVVDAFSVTQGSAFNAPAAPPDEGALARGIETLKGFPFPPYWDVLVTNCDDAEIAAAACTLNDGTQVKLLGNVGWGNDLVADQPIPMRVRPPSNYVWRSNPYVPNGGGDGSRLLPAVDFRMAYWMGRWTRR